MYGALTSRSRECAGRGNEKRARGVRCPRTFVEPTTFEPRRRLERILSCGERQIWKLVEFCLFRYYKQRVNQQDFIFSNINTSRVLQQVFWNQAHTFLDKFEFGNHFRILMSKFTCISFLHRCLLHSFSKQEQHLQKSLGLFRTHENVITVFIRDWKNTSSTHFLESGAVKSGSSMEWGGGFALASQIVPV